MIAAVLSRADGASEVLHGGFVTYTKAHKTSALGVSADLLRDKGAVNEEVVKQLARGALKQFARFFKPRRQRRARTRGGRGRQPGRAGLFLLREIGRGAGRRERRIREEEAGAAFAAHDRARLRPYRRRASASPAPHRNRRTANAPFFQRARCLRQIARAARRRQIGQSIGAALT